MWFVMERVQNSHTLSDRLLETVYQSGLNASSEDTIRKLVSCGADPNRIHGNFLPLQCACITGYQPVVRILLELGADVNKEDGFHRTALHYAAERNPACVAVLLNSGAVVDARDVHGNTPLHWASYKNQPDCMLQLLQAGADANARDFNNDSALSWAALRGHLEAIRILLDYNCRPNSVNLSGSSPLSRLAETIAMGIGSAQEEVCLRLLLEALGQFDLRQHARNHQLPSDLERDKDMRELLMPYCLNPRSLQDQCRWTVRGSLGSAYLPDQVAMLNIPKQLRRYILLQG